MNKTPYEKGVERGLEIACEKGMAMGIERERRDWVRGLLDDLFGPLPAAVLARLEQMPLDQLKTLRKSALKAKSLADLGLQE
jgi:hypothetical protein